MASYVIYNTAVQMDQAISGAYNNIIVRGSGFVRDTGVQTISGQKYFIDDVSFSGFLTAPSGKFGKNSFFDGSNFQTIAGGENNSVYLNYSTVAGGKNNVASGQYSFVGGGGGILSAFGNRALGDYSVIAGGYNNDIFGNYNTCIGGQSNTVSGSNSACVGGSLSVITGNSSFSIGGLNNVYDNNAGCINDGESVIQSSGRFTLLVNFKSGTYINHNLIVGKNIFCANTGSFKTVSGQNLSGNYLSGQTLVINSASLDSAVATSKIQSIGSGVFGGLYITGSGQVPATPTSNGVFGQLVIADGYLYGCTGTNLWGRTHLTGWV